MEYWSPCGAKARRSGRAKSVVLFPPNLVPSRVKSALYTEIDRSRPSAGVNEPPLPYEFADRTMSPNMQVTAEL